MLLKLSNLNSNLALTLGYLNPALNNSAQVINLKERIIRKKYREIQRRIKNCVNLRQDRVKTPIISSTVSGSLA